MESSKQLIVLITKGIDHELSSVALVIACGGLTSGQNVSLFLTSSGVDLIRKRGTSMTEVKPLDPLSAMIEDFQERGGQIWACPPCVKSRGYEEADLIDGVEVVGASKLHGAIRQGAETLSF